MDSPSKGAISAVRRLFRSSIPLYLTLVLGLASIALVFGTASTSMYGVDHVINLVAYWHIPLAVVGGLALTVTFAGCVLYLLTGERFFEQTAHASGEVGFVFVTLTLLSGMTWGRVIWNTWWDWTDVRLVTFLFIWFVYAGYLIIHSSVDRSEQGIRLASVYGVIGFVTVPISYLSTRLWTARLHQPSVANPETEATITASALVVSLLAILALYLSLLGSRVRLLEFRRRLDARRYETQTETVKSTESG